MLDWTKKIPKRIQDVKPSGIRKFFDIVGTMPNAISLGVGEPDFVTPYHIREAAIKSIQKGLTQYTSNWGLLPLREEITRFLKERYDIDYDPKDEAFVTVGASEAIDLALRAVTDIGDEILVPEPSYVSYSPCVTIAGGVAVAVPTVAADEFRLTPEALEAAITPRTKALIFPYPNNPTGATMPKDWLERIVPIIIKHDLIVISDEIYSELTYNSTRHVSIASIEGMRERTIVINGFSKAFAMTGWRIGFAAAPKEIVSVMIKIHQFSIMCAPTAAQHGALKALQMGREDGYVAVNEMKTQYDRRRRLMYNAFTDMGLKCFEPKGAFYMFPSVEKFAMTGDEFAERLLKSNAVAVVPGSAFGGFGKHHIRCCYAVSMKNLEEAFKRIRAFITTLTPSVD